MGQKNSALNAKKSKGEISVENNSGRIRLRYRVNGVRDAINLPYPYNEEMIVYAEVIALELKRDISNGQYDQSKAKYKEMASAYLLRQHPLPVTNASNTIAVPSESTPGDPQPSAAKPPVTSSATTTVLVDSSRQIDQGPNPNITLELFSREKTTLQDQSAIDGSPNTIASLVPLYNSWCKTIRNVNPDEACDYYYIRSWLTKETEDPIADLPTRLSVPSWAPNTYNRRMTYLRDFLAWAKSRGHVDDNPLELVRRRSTKGHPKRAQREPLTENEILQILDAFKNDTFCPKSSRFKHSYYFGFVAFIFYTGVRNGEAIALRVRDVDLISGTMNIPHSMSRTLKGYNSSARVRRKTKSPFVRTLFLSDELKTILSPHLANRSADDLVFPGVRGGCIDDQMFQRRIFKPILRALKIPERDLYVGRHSFGYRAVSQHMALTDLAYEMGHQTINTAIRTYVAIVKKKVKLPAIGKKNE